MQPLVSIIIPVYNGANYLKQAIDSALAQTYKNIEVIVVNDGSNDGGETERIALSYGDKIRYFAKENGGSSSALNYGINNMRGEWFSWLSHDDVYSPDKIKKQVEYLARLETTEENIKNHFVFTAIEYIDKSGNCFRRTSKHDAEKIAREVERIKGNEYLIAEPTKYNFYGCTCLIHKRLLEKVGMFDESLRLVNDIDMWFRLYASGAKIHFMPEILAQARIHTAQVSRSIGFSYHNPEQDMLWSRTLAWLEEYHPDETELFYMFGRNALVKTRFIEGKKAFAIAEKLAPKRRIRLRITKNIFICYARFWKIAKDIYIKVKL